MMGRPRLHLGAPRPIQSDSEPDEAAPTTPEHAAAADPADELPTMASPPRWTRPALEPAVPPVLEPISAIEPEPRSTADQGVFRRSPAKKRNRTISVPAELAIASRASAVSVGLSVTDTVFIAVESHIERLRSAPHVAQNRLGRVIAPKAAAGQRAHLVLYLADDEWDRWQDVATRAGLATLSALVTAALRQQQARA